MTPTHVELIDDDIHLILDQELSPKARSAALAAEARATLAEQESLNGGRGYQVTVDGRANASEDSVKPDGEIVYTFNWWGDIIRYALQFLVERSPEKSGAYKRAWFVMVDGDRVSDFDQIPDHADVVITNDQPYARKIDVGHMRMSVPPGIIEDGRQALQGFWGNVLTVQHTSITLPNGYVLKGRFRKGVGRRARTRLAKDTQAGAQMTYPALVLKLAA